MKPIAVRVFELADGGEVRALVDAPKEAVGHWSCGWRVTWPDDTESGTALGQGSLQALLYAIRTVGVALAERGAAFDVRSLVGPGPDGMGRWLRGLPRVHMNPWAAGKNAPRDELLFGNPDHLTQGPLPPMGADPTAWVADREKDYVERFAGAVGQLSYADLRAFLAAPSVIVYCSDALNDQLQLAWAVVSRALAGRQDATIALAVAPALPSGSGVRYSHLADFRAADWAAVEPRQLDADECDAARVVWDAVTHSTADALFALGPLPKCFRSVPWLVGRYPDRASGLDFWEEHLLRLVRPGRSTWQVLGRCLDFGLAATPDHIIADSLTERLAHLAGPTLARPLLTAEPVEGERHPMYELTAFGEAVLEGRENHVSVNGIDRWVGGVHLTPENAVWRPEDWAGAHLSGSDG